LLSERRGDDAPVLLEALGEFAGALLVRLEDRLDHI